jgi:hypothetical protein
MMKKYFLVVLLLSIFGGAKIFAQNQPCGDTLHYLQMNVSSGSWGNEMSWTLLNDANQPVNGGGGYGNNQAFTLTQCLPSGCYTMHLHDSFGDGWNGGTMEIFLDGQSIFSGTLASGSDMVFTIAMDAMGCESSIPVGCLDPAAANYNPAAIMSDGNCIYLGCTDPYAMNYNASATQNDSSCVYCNEGVYAHVYVCAFSYGNQINLSILDSNGVSIFNSPILNNGAIYHTDVCLDSSMCYTAVMTNNAGLTGWNNGYFWISVGGVQVINQSLDATATSEEANFSMFGPCNVPVIPGCTDVWAMNYNPQANMNDSTCVFPIYGCMDMNAMNYSNEANVNSNCIYPNMCGNMNLIYIESNSSNVDYTGYYSILDEYNNMLTYSYVGESSYACVNDGCYSVQYNTWETNPASDTILVQVNNNQIYSFTTSQMLINLSTFCVNDTTGFGLTIEGCMDTTAMNYNSMATQDDNSCIYYTDCPNGFSYIQGSTGSWGNEMSFDILNSAGEVIYAFEGSTSNTPFMEYACLTPDCYTVEMTDSWGDGWNGGYVYLFESAGAGNFQGILNWGNSGWGNYSVGGMCAEELWGCMDIAALNYASWATQDDGSCMYNDNDTINWNPGMALNSNWEVKVFPNPSNDMVWLNVSGLNQNELAKYQVFAADGRLVCEKSFTTNGNSNFVVEGIESETGIFFVKLIIQNESKLTRVIKL